MNHPAAGRVSTPTPPRPRRARPSQVLGELLLTFGVLLLLFVFYEAYWTNLDAGRRQDHAEEALARQWEVERVNPRQNLNPEMGEAFARLHIPTFGSDFHFAILEGTDERDLLAGPGHYVETQLPGQAGNFAVAGHRVGKGAPFNDLGNLQVCDAVVIETRNSWETYRILPIAGTSSERAEQAGDCFSPEQARSLTQGSYSGVQGRHITLPGDIGVLSPVPGQDMTLTEDLEGILTLTTCHPRFSNEQRMIVHAMLVDSTPKEASGDARPAALGKN